jgi:hypothetical protein
MNNLSVVHNPVEAKPSHLQAALDEVCMGLGTAEEALDEACRNAEEAQFLAEDAEDEATLDDLDRAVTEIETMAQTISDLRKLRWETAE